MKKDLEYLCKQIPYCRNCKKTFNMPYHALCCLFDCGKYEECEGCHGGIYSEEFKNCVKRYEDSDSGSVEL